MNLKKNKGSVGVDISIALIAILIIIPTITGIIYNINKTNAEVERKSQAMNIAVNVMEIAKGFELEDLNTDDLFAEIANTYTSSTAESNVQTDGSKTVLVIEIENVAYKVELEITDYSEIQSSATENIVKTVKTIITYKVGGEEKELDLSTVVT